jgi:hypothetical protein
MGAPRPSTPTSASTTPPSSIPIAAPTGQGATANRFFPALGNHDWHTTAGSPPLPQPSLDYFDLPGNERYYDVVIGPVHVFVVDSDAHEPDGIESTSVQADWLRQGLVNSTAPWRIVTMHHPPYSSSLAHGSTPAMQWPYADWGATAVFAGHDHTYERIVRDGIVYFVNGIGGADALPDRGRRSLRAKAIFNADYGAMLIEATTDTITYTLAARTGVVYDTYVQHATDYPLPDTPLPVGISTRIAASADDAEEFVGTHKVNLTSTDLEFTTDPGDPTDTQLVGMRFTGVQVPPGATIARAYIELAVDEATTGGTSLSFAAEASDAPAPFQAVERDLSQRVRTTARVTWDDVPDWTTVGRLWRTPNLAPIVQEIVNRPGVAGGTGDGLPGRRRRPAHGGVFRRQPGARAAVAHRNCLAGTPVSASRSSVPDTNDCRAHDNRLHIGLPETPRSHSRWLRGETLT